MQDRQNIWADALDDDDYEPEDAAGAAQYYAEKHGEALYTIRNLRMSVALALAQRDTWWPCAFAAGIACGIGLAVLW